MSTETLIINSPVIACIVLAAGSSTRFGTDKRQYLLDGKSLLQQSLQKPLALELPTLLVLKREDSDQLSRLTGIYHNSNLLSICYSNDAHLGIGHSISAAIACLENTNIEYDGALIILADMPWLEISTIKNLLQHFQPGKIIAPFVKGENGIAQQGHPVLFSKRWFPALRQLEGDSGAKQLITNNADLIKIAVNDASIIKDIDDISDTKANVQKT